MEGCYIPIMCGDSGVMLETYSTTKTAIGTWIDGKTIYRVAKEVVYTPEDNLDFRKFVYYLTGIQVDQVINLRGYAELTNTAYKNNKFIMNIPVCNKRIDLNIDYYYGREHNAVEISGSMGGQYKLDRLFVIVEFTER